MRFRSFCSGIESASVAWEPLGWSSVSFSEIEPFCCALLSHHYPQVPNLGDLLTIKDEDVCDDRADIWVAGTPCQSFSVAGLRGGLDDARGNLALRFFQLARRARPRWVVWENVPGVLSSNEGKDFGTILGALAECGYGFAYRVLDAQYFGLAQRRKRVFVVGCLGDWRGAAAVLLERAGLRGDSAPSREAGEEFTHPVAPCLDASGCGFARSGDNRGRDPVIAVPQVLGTLQANYADKWGLDNQRVDAGCPMFVHSLRASGFDAGEDGTGRGTPLVPVGFISTFSNQSAAVDHSPTLSSRQMAVAFAQNQVGEVRVGSVLNTLNTNSNASGRNAGLVAHMGVRRITPTEAERLQGFPDGYTAVPYRGKPAADGPRYRALGNSKAVPVVRWIGERIQMVDAITPQVKGML